MKKICEECHSEFDINPKNKRSSRKRFCSGNCAKRNNGKGNKGKKHSIEINKKKGLSGELNPFYGKNHSDEFKKKLSKDRRGKTFSPEVNKKKGRPGELNGFFGKTHTVESKCIISEKSLINSAGEKNGMYGKGYKLIGDKNGGWYGGISENPYGPEFNRTLKNKIRKRDNFKCAICKEDGYDVHHIDYDKENNLEENLITLCHKDHMKTNINRESWMEFFKIYKKSIIPK